MSKLFYNLSVGGYYLLVWIASFFNQKARRFIDGRKTIFDDLEANLANNQLPVIWFHAASLGEFEQGRPVMEKLKAEIKDFFLLITFFSPSGYEIRKDYALADYITYLPVDTSRNAKRFMDIVEPDIAVFIKYEFWYHFINEAHKRDTVLISISSIFRKKQMVFHPMGYFFRRMLRKIDCYFVQDKRSSELLKRINISNCVISGDTRFDRVIEIADSVKPIDKLASFPNDLPVFVIGSAWPIDMHYLMRVLNDNIGRMKVVLAPHNIIDREIRQFENAFQGKSLRYSKVDKLVPTDIDVLIIDNIGMLSSLYQYGSFAFVGGGFRGGLHNTLEAAVYGIPVLFGKHENNAKFNEAAGLILSGGGFEISSESEVGNIIGKFISEPEVTGKIGEKCSKYVREHAGATNKIVAYIKDVELE